LTSATDRELWQGPKQEVRESRTSAGLCAQPQKFERITVTIGKKNGQLLLLRVILAPVRALDPWRWPKGSQLWGGECITDCFVLGSSCTNKNSTKHNVNVAIFCNISVASALYPL